MNAAILSQPIVLMDRPDVVDLKRQFRKLDEQEETLKPLARAGVLTAVNELEFVRTRKQVIAREIFAANQRDVESHP